MASVEWELFQLLEQVPTGIVVVTAEGKPYYANRRARVLLGIGNVPEHVSQFSEVYHAYEIGTDHLYPVERLPGVRALAGESCEISDIELRRDGETTPLHITGAPVKLKDELRFAIMSVQDVRELRRIATRDALTGLPNRSVFAEAFTRERLLAERTGAPIAIALIDFDGFKQINDTYGHAAGDEVLRRGCTTIVDALRRTDVVARWGGEELAVLLPNTSVLGARDAIDKALVAVRELEFPGGLRVTFSAGVVDGPGTLEELVRRADRALYEAKRTGRDRVMSASES